MYPLLLLLAMNFVHVDLDQILTHAESAQFIRPETFK